MSIVDLTSIEALARRQRRGFSLERPFYVAPNILEAEYDRVLTKQWLIVDHVSRIPEPGCFFLYEILDESVIVARGRDGEIRAFHNVCRHRGSRVCLEPEGRTNAFVCPYHAWSYDLEGRLRAARLAPEGFDKALWSLKPCHARVRHGMIFLNLAAGDPPDFDAQYEPLIPYMAQQGLERARIATWRRYPTAANWKLVVENFFECYHCKPSHREFCAVHSPEKLLSFGAGPSSGSDEGLSPFQPELEAWEAGARALGHLTGWFSDPDDAPLVRAGQRLPVRQGFLSETPDGRPVAPLMAGFKGFDGGQTAVTLNPLSTLLMANDFAVLFRFTPRGAETTDVDLLWMVHEDAVEGRDYDLEKLCWLWEVTTQQDKKITEDNAAGVRSRHYEPGPYTDQELATARVIAWYLDRLLEGPAP